MNCADVEIWLCDYLDGALAPERRMELESHLAGCTMCAEFARDAGAGFASLQHLPDAIPPQELVTRIMQQAPATGWLNRLVGSGGPLGARLSAWLAPALQPKPVMGAMMTILSLSVLTHCAGVPARTLKAEDLNPERVWVNFETKVERVYDRTVKTYQSMKLVYEVRQELHDLREQQQEQDAAAPVQSREIPTHPAAPAGEPGKN